MLDMSEEQKYVRPSWDEYFMNICKAVALRSHDENTQVGCVIVNAKKRIVSTGYNGLPAGVDDSVWATRRDQIVKIPCVHQENNIVYDVDKYDTVTHAEANAIVSASEPLYECSLYSNLYPCNECAKMIITAGIKKVFYEDIREWKAHAIAKLLFKQAGIEEVCLKKEK
jgi:dCMP deaminase